MPPLPQPPVGGAASGAGIIEQCTSFSAEACPASCAVCPPCEVCSSISCQSEEFCKSIGFEKGWYEGIKKNLASSQAQAQQSGEDWQDGAFDGSLFGEEGINVNIVLQKEGIYSLYPP
ncbi:MAG: hypothetical protein WC588_05695, partial [Candidatus Micrarchaeia archaeon]